MIITMVISRVMIVMKILLYSKIYVPVKEIEISTNVGLATKDGWIYDLVKRYWLRNDVKFRHK